jgi:hypothetical protein
MLNGHGKVTFSAQPKGANSSNVYGKRDGRTAALFVP